MQKIAVIPVSDEGRDIAETLQQEFQASVIKRAEVAKRWKEFDAFIFVGAMGDDTVVANCVEDKLIVDIIDSEGNVLNAVTLGDECDHSFCIKGRNVYIITTNKELYI